MRRAAHQDWLCTVPFGMERESQIHPAASGKPTALLLVEDDALTSSLLDYLFTRQGYHVQVSHDGREAAERIQGDLAPDLVVMDLMLPYVDGFELLQMMRQSPAWAEVPVLVLSGKSQEEDIVRAFRLGASDFVAKPFRTNELMVRVGRLVKPGPKT